MGLLLLTTKNSTSISNFDKDVFKVLLLVRFLLPFLFSTSAAAATSQKIEIVSGLDLDRFLACSVIFNGLYYIMKAVSKKNIVVLFLQCINYHFYCRTIGIVFLRMTTKQAN